MVSLVQRWAKLLWRWLTGLSLRAVVVLVLMTYLALPASLLQAPTLDRASAKAASYLLQAPQTLRGVTVIEVPRDLMLLWAGDLHSAGTLSALLANVLHSQSSFVSILLPQALSVPEGPSERLLDDFSGDNVNAAALLERKRFLLNLLKSERVLVGVHPEAGTWSFAGAAPIAVQDPLAQKVPSSIRRWLWPAPPDLGGANRPRPSIEQFPASTLSHSGVSLLYRQGESSVLPNFLLQNIRKQQKLGWGEGVFPFVWDKAAGVQVGDVTIHTSPAASVLPLWGLTERMQPYIERLSLEEGLARGAFPDYVYIIPKGERGALDTVLAAGSLRNGDYLRQPVWVAPAQKVLGLLLVLYLLLVIPRVSVRTALWVSATSAVALFLSAVVAGATQGTWLPIGVPIVLLVFGHLLMHIWQGKQRSWDQLAQRAEKASVLQASIYLSNGELDEAYDALKDCRASDEAFSYLYDLSGMYASKRRYDQSLQVLDTLLSACPTYKDAKQKRSAIESVYRSQQNPLEKTALMVDATVAVDAKSVDRPVLGRYEIKSALGKGAMGQVYLGFDPRIARQVAIKTLSFNQFDLAQLPNIKQRFFREAEAAGRLNHPNIVSVYDVGEEPDLAYIAMDYVEGSPLSAFVNANNLLPAFEVYRIIHDVAVALQYAHQNQIVHRDIKPGNIMYRPSPYQLKVADFGIARLTDNSQTTTGEILGSPLYMAPEQLKGKRVDYAADLFSLGVTFYQLLSGHLPFNGDNLASLTYEIIHGKHKSVRQFRKDLPTSAARITNQALQKNAGDRYSSAAEMAAALNKAIKRDFSQEAKRAGFN